jgi:hypothetical protein
MIYRSIIHDKHFSLQTCSRYGGKNGAKALLYVILYIVVYNDNGELHKNITVFKRKFLIMRGKHSAHIFPPHESMASPF